MLEPTTEIPLLPTFLLLSRAQQKGEFPAVIRVQNLQTSILTSGHDAWDRSRRLQPCFVSFEVGFREPFDTASSTDKLGGDTVHYGVLSNTIRECVDNNFGPNNNNNNNDDDNNNSAEHDEEECGGGGTTQEILKRIWEDLTTTSYDGTPSRLRKAGLLSQSLGSRIKLLTLTVKLPRASLLGEVVSYTASAVYSHGGGMEARALRMSIDRLRVPTLIGLNENEREAKQMLVVSVTVDGVAVENDRYYVVERAVVKALEESSFETLEALGAHLIDKVEEVFVNGRDYTVHIKMEKPIAVPMAECPVVEMRRTVKDYHR